MISIKLYVKLFSLVLCATLLLCACTVTTVRIEEEEETITTTVTEHESGNYNSDTEYLYKINEQLPEAEQNKKEFNRCFDKLNKKQKRIYNILSNACENLVRGELLIKGEPERNDIYIAYDALLDDKPEFFYLNTQIGVLHKNNEVYIYLLYYMSDDQIQTAQEELYNLNQQIKPYIRGNTDYQKVLSIHDFLCRTTAYSKDFNNPLIYTAYGALINGDAVCEGYSKAMLYLCSLYGIESVLVTGKDQTDQPHMWNQVKMNGEWYNVDATFNDSESFIYRTYFGLSNQRISFDRTFFEDFYSVNTADEDLNRYFNFNNYDCHSDYCNFFYQNGAVLNDDTEKSQNAIIKAALNNIINGELYAELTFEVIPENLNGEYMQSNYSVNGCVDKINTEFAKTDRPAVKLKSFAFTKTTVRMFFE